MAHARRRERRQLALDVRGLIWTRERIDGERFLRLGAIAVFKTQMIPDTPEMQKAREQAKAEAEYHKSRRRNKDGKQG